jgi:hypothetical protein
MLRFDSKMIGAVLAYILYDVLYKGQSWDIQTLLIDPAGVVICTLLVTWISRVAWSALQHRFRGRARHRG